ncbi:Hypothetical predicted protein [Lecanosticta acicola]|uniref:Uncharacterized protein n=1 Tax=Lecanosticta acicola TaxID=111012 RepID=A0AAI8Z5R3_9PEZI|nr:Hypothetical predicted protein [Lecanosticta acicola]
MDESTRPDGNALAEAYLTTVTETPQFATPSPSYQSSNVDALATLQQGDIILVRRAPHRQRPSDRTPRPHLFVFWHAAPSWRAEGGIFLLDLEKIWSSAATDIAPFLAQDSRSDAAVELLHEEGIDDLVLAGTEGLIDYTDQNESLAEVLSSGDLYFLDPAPYAIRKVLEGDKCRLRTCEDGYVRSRAELEKSHPRLSWDVESDGDVENDLLYAIYQNGGAALCPICHGYELIVKHSHLVALWLDLDTNDDKSQPPQEHSDEERKVRDELNLVRRQLGYTQFFMYNV